MLCDTNWTTKRHLNTKTFLTNDSQRFSFYERLGMCSRTCICGQIVQLSKNHKKHQWRHYHAHRMLLLWSVIITVHRPLHHVLAGLPVVIWWPRSVRRCMSGACSNARRHHVSCSRWSRRWLAMHAVKLALWWPTSAVSRAVSRMLAAVSIPVAISITRAALCTPATVANTH